LDWMDIAKDIAVFGGGASGFVALLKLRWDAQDRLRKAKEAEAAAAAERSAAEAAKEANRNELVQIATEAAGKVISDLSREIDRLRKQLDEVEAEFAEFRKAHDTMIADKEAELLLLRGRLRQLEATVDAYDRLLTAHAIPHERPPQIYYENRAGETRPIELGAP